MLKNNNVRRSLFSGLLIVLAFHTQSASAALIELGPALYPDTPDAPIIDFFNRASAHHYPLFPNYTMRAQDYSHGGTWEAASGAVTASTSATTSESGSIYQSLQVGTREGDGTNWGYVEASASGTVIFMPTQRLRYTLEANFSLEHDIDLSGYSWGVELWEWQDDIVPLQSFLNPENSFSGTVSGFLEEGVVYGLSSGLAFYGDLDESVPTSASLVEGAGFANLNLTVVPLPATVWLFGSALLGLGVIKRKRA